MSLRPRVIRAAWGALLLGTGGLVGTATICRAAIRDFAQPIERDIAPRPIGGSAERGLPRETSGEQLQRLAARRGSHNEAPEPALPPPTPPPQQTQAPPPAQPPGQ